MRESVIAHLYGASKKDHINYSHISSIESGSNADNKENETLKQIQQPADHRRVILPSFKEMINHVCEMNKRRLGNSSTQRFTYGQINFAFSYETITEV